MIKRGFHRYQCDLFSVRLFQSCILQGGSVYSAASPKMASRNKITRAPVFIERWRVAERVVKMYSRANRGGELTLPLTPLDLPIHLARFPAAQFSLGHFRCLSAPVGGPFLIIANISEGISRMVLAIKITTMVDVIHRTNVFWEEKIQCPVKRYANLLV